MKYPIERYLSVVPLKGTPNIGLQPIKPQIALINAVNDPRYRFITACLSRRTGKTYMANIILQLVSLSPGSEVLIMAPDYSLAGISWDLQRFFLNHFGIERIRENSKDRVIELANGSIIRIGSVSRVDSTVGRSYDLIIFDEAALTSEGENAFNISLRPTLDKKNSKCIFISTPRGDNWFKKFYDRGWNPKYPQWFSVRSSWHENPRASVADIEEAKNSMSSAEFAQEYLADFTTFEGQIYQSFDESIHVQNLEDLDFTNMDVIGGLDLGYRDPTAFVVIAVDAKGTCYVLSAWQYQKLNTRDVADRLHTDIANYGIDYIYVDPANATQVADLAMLYDISAINAEKSQVDGFSFVEMMFEQNRLIIDQKCKGLISSLKNLRWDTKALRPKQLHDDNTHYCDALRYALYTYAPNLSIIMESEDADYEEDELIAYYEREFSEREPGKKKVVDRLADGEGIGQLREIPD